MACASIPNITQIATFAVVLTGAAAGCGSAVFYDEVPDDDETAAAWKDAPVVAPGPSWEDGLSCEDSVGIARVRVLGGIETAKALGDWDRQQCLADKAQLLGALAVMISREEARDAACGQARVVFAAAQACGG